MFRIFDYHYQFMLALTIFAICESEAQGQISSQELEVKIDAMFADKKGENVPGAAIVVVKDGNVLLEKAYGMANLEHRVPIDRATVFDLASVSKQFTGFAISKLVEAGKIDLDDDIRMYIPELPDFGHKISIDHLVHHTSGIRDWTSTLPLAGWQFDDVISMQQILRMALQQDALNFVPGSQYVYSNTGYNLLAELVHRITGLTFAEWTKSNIFEPLGMKNTRFLDDHTTLIPDRASSYYKGEDGTYHVATNNLTALGSSSLFSTTADLAKWVINLDRPSENQKQVVNRMFTKGVLNNGDEISYAFGLSINERNGIKWISHGGSWASFRSHLAYLPAHHLSVIVLINEPGNTYRMAQDIAKLFIQYPTTASGDEADQHHSIKVEQQILDECTGTYRLGPGWYVTITRQDEQLWTQATDEDNYPMTTRSDSLFWIKAYGGRTMTFIRDDRGTVTHVKYNNQLNPKVGGIDLKRSENYEDYVGEYRSDELQTTYRVMLDDGALKLQHFRHGTLELSQAWNDDFRGASWFILSVAFQRNTSGVVDGLKVWNHRARNQIFRKVK